MDPYLESHWEDVHHSLTTYARDAVQPRLAGDLIARLAERIYSDPGGEAEVEADPVVEPLIKILDAGGNRTVTVVDFISPGNKASGEGRSAYLQTRGEFVSGGANLVEVDLMRRGGWVSLLSPHDVPTTYQTTYHVSVQRADPERKAELYPIRLQSNLPTVSVPLRAGEPDVLLDLQAIFDQAYVNGRYAATNYRPPCDPPLTGSDVEWADQLLRAAGRR